METTDYDALLEKRYATPGELAQRLAAVKLAEMARNAESLRKLAEAEGAPDELEAAPPVEAAGAPPEPGGPK